MKIRLIIQIVLAIAILAFAYKIYESIMAPVRFNQEKDSRRSAVIDKLKDIREVQGIYLSMNGKYCSTFDSLIMFVKNEKIPIVKLTARPGDSTFTNPIRDTVDFVTVIDSLFGKREGFNIDNIAMIPYSDENGEKADTFEMKVAVVEKGTVPVNVIEVFAPNRTFLKGLDLKKNNIDPEDGLRFGSLSDPSTDGNWE